MVRGPVSQIGALIPQTDRRDTMANQQDNPQPDRDQSVDPYVAGKAVGERQDGAGAAPPRADRHDALPAGETTRQRREGAAQGQPEEPAAEHRGEPAALTTGAATGSGSGAGGGGTGQTEEPDPDSAGGGGRDHGFARRD
jgi:hypothetical protein